MVNLHDIFFPLVAEAAAPPIPASVMAFIGKVSTEIINPIIAVLFGIAMFYFLYGIAAYIWNPDDEQAREKGRQGMLWGIIGMFVMVSVFGIIRFLIDSTGANPALINYI